MKRMMTALQLARQLGLSAERCCMVLLIVAASIVSSCAPRGSIKTLTDPSIAFNRQDILVASMRQPTSGSAVLSGSRAANLSYFDFAVSVPTERVPGTVKFSTRNPPDPKRDFATIQADRLPNAAALKTVINRRLDSGASPQGEVVLFIHGFNTNFAEGLYRQAQLAHDFASDAISVNFSWASAGSVRGYAFDRESALVARDALETVIATIQDSKAKRIVIIAHSMGAQLAMETLRQMGIRGRPGGFRKLASVVLVAPDLDVDVFLSQAQQLARQDIPIYVFVSRRDRALQLSNLLRGGGTARLGLVTDAAVLGDLPVAIIDTSEFEGNGDPLQHFKAATSPTMIALLSGSGTEGLRALAQNVDAQPGLLQGGVEAIQGAASTLLVGD